jgi:hypothetical protein
VEGDNLMASFSELFGGGGATEIRASRATGVAPATIVTALANTGGVIISTVCITVNAATGTGRTTCIFTAGGDAILQVDGDFESSAAASLSNLLVPAGEAVAFTVSGTASSSNYAITYEVL